MSNFVSQQDLADLGHRRRGGWRGGRRWGGGGWWPGAYPVYVDPVYVEPEVVRVVDESLDPLAEERKKRAEEEKLQALKAKLKEELKKELAAEKSGAMSDMGRRGRWGGGGGGGRRGGGWWNPYAAQNYAQAMYEATVPYYPPVIVEAHKVVSPQAAELDLLYSDAAPGQGVGHEADEGVSGMGWASQDDPGARPSTDSSMPDAGYGLGAIVPQVAANPTVLAFAAMGAVAWWLASRRGKK